MRCKGIKINNNVYALQSTKGSYAYVILGKEIILVDTGQMWEGRAIIKELLSMNIRLEDIKHIVLTHHDLDHVGNAAKLQKLTNAKLYASVEDIPYIMGYKTRPGIKKLFSFIFRVKKPKNVIAYNKNSKIGDIEVIATPGHTPGHVCILYEDILFVGDLVKSQKGSLIPYPNMNWNEVTLMKSIENIGKLPFKWICPAHGEPVERDNLWENILHRNYSNKEKR
jgi:glyoxylase-like metal-dependent hydrolase (beta-lactamase superfamily II)